jgi:hypothetical protein
MADPFCCPDLGGTPRGAGTNCADPDICKGACCHGNGTCTQTTQAACNGANDTFKGIGTNCADFQPTITAQPQSVTACVGENAVFTIAATGTGTLHYQWQKNGANIGADAATLTLMAVQVADDSAVITCKVTDDCGMVNSAAATLLVLGLTSQTESLVPANRDRLTLGIGERVTISTNPARVVNWAVAGGGAVAPAMGAATVFTASMSPSTSTITATLGAKACTIVFEVIAPTGINFAVDNNPGCGVAGPPNNEIGARTVFDFTIQPVTVSFYRANFRENIPGNAWVWPDGTAGAFPAQVVPYMVNQANSGEDTSSNCTFPIGRLDPPPPGGGLMAFTYNINVPGEYQNQGGAWVVFIAGETHPKEFDAAGQCRTIINATNGATNGAWQGPWQ